MHDVLQFVGQAVEATGVLIMTGGDALIGGLYACI